MASTDNQIQIKGNFRREEATGSGTVKPGYLLELTSAGAVKAHAIEGGYAERIFAVEDALQGGTVDDSYANGALVSYNVAEPGSEVNAILKAGFSYTKGQRLVSAGDGSLLLEDDVASDTTVKQIIGVCMEALDLTGSGAVATRSLVRLV